MPVSFGGAHIADSNKQIASNVTGAAKLIDAQLGVGRLIWCPLPIELNERNEPLEAVYTEALNKAGVAPELEWLHGGDLPGVYGRKLSFAKGALYIFVSELGSDQLTFATSNQANVSLSRLHLFIGRAAPLLY